MRLRSSDFAVTQFYFLVHTFGDASDGSKSYCCWCYTGFLSTKLLIISPSVQIPRSLLIISLKKIAIHLLFSTNGKVFIPSEYHGLQNLTFLTNKKGEGGEIDRYQQMPISKGHLQVIQVVCIPPHFSALPWVDVGV